MKTITHTRTHTHIQKKKTLLDSKIVNKSIEYVLFDDGDDDDVVVLFFKMNLMQ